MRVHLVKDNKVVNTVVLPDGWQPGDPRWVPPAGHELVADDTIAIGHARVAGVWTRPPEPMPAPPPVDPMQALLDKLVEKGGLTEADIAEIKAR